MPNKTAQELKRQFLNAKTIDLHPHRAPDDDAINSVMVIYNWLKNLRKEVSICVNPESSKKLRFKPQKYNIKDFKNTTPADVACILDFNDPVRMSQSYTNLINKQKPQTIIGIDHHAKETPLSKNLYIDSTSRSCCELVYMFFQTIGRKLNKNDLTNLYCGMLSDYQKSSFIKIESSLNSYKLIKLTDLKKDKNATRILGEIEARLSETDKQKIYKYLDTLSHLNKEEKVFRKTLFSKVKVTPNGKLAYVVIDPQDEQWASLGMDNTKTSAILGDLRQRLLNGVQKDPLFSPEQKKSLENLQGAIIFYRTSKDADSTYRMSLTSKNNYAITLVEHIKTHINPKLIAGGHPNRKGGMIKSFNQKEVNEFVNHFLQAANEIV